MSGAIGNVLNRLTECGSRPRRSGGGWSARCPAHADHNPSLSVGQGEGGRILVRCHAGCDLDAILGSLGLTVTDLAGTNGHAPDHQWTPAGPEVARYVYVDEAGAELFTVHRAEGKAFRQSRPDASAPHGRRWKLDDTRRVLYRLPRVIEAVERGDTIYVVEGEKDVHAIERAGGVATCNPGGAGKWLHRHADPPYRQVLAGARVIVVADRDPTGADHARQVAADLAGHCQVAVVQAAEGKDAADHLATGHGLGDLVLAAARPLQLYPDLDEFLAQPDPDYDWLVPDLIERGDRIVLTGGEGAGKSTLCRQIAVQVASGVHPFAGRAIDPLRVLLIDLENSPRQSKRKLRPLRELAGDRYTHKRMTPIVDPQLRPDLYRPTDREHLAAIVANHPCDLLVIGPVYKLASGDPTTEEHAPTVTAAILELRARHDIAVLMEHHPPHQQTGRTTRALRPYGASLWLRWPEFGLGLDDNGVVSHWRGARDERSWPTALQRGGPGRWPWVPSVDTSAVLWGRIVSHAAGSASRPSYRDFAEALDTPKSTVERAINAHRDDWDAMQRELWK